jgi:hypothetical protein
MPHRRPPVLRANATLTPRTNFRRRYDELEAQRAALISRVLGSQPTAAFALTLGRRT